MRPMARCLCVVFLCALSTGCALFQIGKHNRITVLTHDQFNNLAPALSPDGAKVAFSSDRSGNWDIWVMRADGSGLQQITTDPTADLYASWSPDGRQLAFASMRSGNWDIWVMAADGSHQTQITDRPQVDHSPAWSPDGKKIAFVSLLSHQLISGPEAKDIGDFDIWTMDPNGSNMKEFLPNCGDWGPSWSPDSRVIAHASSKKGMTGIRVIFPDTGLVDFLTPREEQRDFLPAWSPDGSKIAFLSDRNGERNIWLMDKDSKNQHPITRNLFGRRQPKFHIDQDLYNGIGYYYLSWHPAGTQIAFTQLKKDGKGAIALLELEHR